MKKSRNKRIITLDERIKAVDHICNLQQELHFSGSDMALFLGISDNDYYDLCNYSEKKISITVVDTILSYVDAEKLPYHINATLSRLKTKRKGGDPP